jgi:outer membrane protein OmpA-like peptidoglycan-associated protein
MVYCPFRSIGRFGLAACAVSLGVASLSAQTAPSTTAPVGPNPSRVDVFLGFSYYGAHGEVKPGFLPYSSIDLGAVGSGAYYFNKYVGAEVEGFNHPSGVNDGLSSYSAGLIVRAPMQNFTVFAHGLAGGARLGGPNNEDPASVEHEPYRWGPTLTAGGGMDYDLPFLNNKFSLRLFEADYQYVHADYGPYVGIPTGGVLGGRANLSGVDLSAGIVAHFGHIIPPPPVTYACSVAPASGYPGDPITVTGTAMNLNPKKTATYSWSSTGGAISGTTSTATIDTHSAQPGTYTVTGHVSEGAKPGQMADCTASFTINAFQPPTVGCSANPSTVNPGDSSTITANGVSPQNRPLTYSYSASAGSISGSTSTATLSTTGAAPGTITVTCNVVDDKGQTASQTTQVTVVTPPAPAAPTTTSLCSISFDRDEHRPTRVDNEGKACLDDLALNLQQNTGATLDLVGNASTTEKDGPKKAAERAVNTKDYLVKEKGIDGTRIKVFTGSDDAKTVTTTLVPTGATPVTATPVDETVVIAVPRTPLHERHEKKHHHHKKAAASNS